MLEKKYLKSLRYRLDLHLTYEQDYASFGLAAPVLTEVCILRAIAGVAAYLGYPYDSARAVHHWDCNMKLT